MRMGSNITPFDGLIAEGRVRVRTQGSGKKGSKEGGGKIGGLFNKWGIRTWWWWPLGSGFLRCGLPHKGHIKF